MTELLRALAVMAEPPRRETARLAVLLGLPQAPDPGTFADLFVLQFPPYASVYVGAEGGMGGEARDRVAGFWRALGLEPPVEPDHLAALLGLYAALAEHEASAETEGVRARWYQARTALLWEHLASWLPPYLSKLDRVAPDPYATWSRLLRRALRAEEEVGLQPRDLPVHLRSAPLLPADDAEAEEWIGALLAPARSGVILARSDLARAGRELGLGVRAGERRLALRMLLEQDGPRVCGWLAAEARRAAADVEEDGGPFEPVARFWAARARAMAERMEKGSGVF